jgi:Flp pilus assembly protein TadD
MPPPPRLFCGRTAGHDIKERPMNSLRLALTLALTLVASAAHATCLRPAPDSADSARTALAGETLSATAAARLERLLARNPDDLSAHVQLLGYYGSRQYSSDAARKALRAHVLWLIRNRPAGYLAGTPFAEINLHMDRRGYETAKKLWLAQTLSHPQDAAVLGNAARFFTLDDRGIAESLLLQAHKVQPGSPAWPQRLGELYMLQGGAPKAKQALAQFELAQTLDHSESSRFARINSLMTSAFDAGELEKAAGYAHASLEMAPRFHDNWNYGNAIHHGNIVLGRIALRQGNMRQAEALLLKAGATPGSPQLDSFGPNMTLAKELLEKGERDTVLQYFALCRKFWQMGGKDLDAWTRRVKTNRMPDFGANLRY